MKNVILLCVLLASIAMKAQEKQKIRIAEIEVFPEFLEEYLLKAKNVGAISVEKEKRRDLYFSDADERKPNANPYHRNLCQRKRL